MRALPFLCCVLLTACGAAPPGTTTPRPQRSVLTMEEMRITAERDGEGGFTMHSYDAETLFRRAVELQDRHCARAVELYDRIADEFPTSRYRSAALYNAGLCLGKDEATRAEAALRFERLLREEPSSSDVEHASFNLALLRVQLERWDATIEVADQLLARDDLTSEERLEAMARRAQGLLGAGRLDEAERQARTALAYYRTRRGEAEIRDELFAAISNYVLAETMRERAAAITIPEASIERQRERLERRASLMLDAQREYFDTIRLTNAHWAAASGYRIGSMYDAFWHAIMEAPVPPPPDTLPPGTEDIFRAEYRAELARTVRPLIRNAIRYWELTLMMVERTGVQNQWVDKLRADLDTARQRLLAQPGVAMPPSPATPARDPDPPPNEHADGLATPDRG